MDIALIGVIATFIAFRIAGMTTGREAGAPLNRKKFLIHLGILVLLSSYCIVSGIIKISSGKDRKLQEHLAALRWKSESLTLNGRAAEATTTASETLALARAAYGDDDVRILPYLSLLASRLGQERRFAEAEASAQRALEIAVKAYGKGGPEVALEENNLGALYADMGRLDRAEVLYRSALASVDRGSGPVPSVLPAVLNNLAALCEQTGRTEEAGRLRDRAKGFRPKSP